MTSDKIADNLKVEIVIEILYWRPQNAKILLRQNRSLRQNLIDSKHKFIRRFNHLDRADYGRNFF